MITLNEDKSVCNVADGVELRLQQSIDFKSAVDNKISIGKIEGFMYAGYEQENKASIWMRLVDVEDSSSEWISVTVWNSQRERGFFGDAINKPKAKKNASKKSEDLSGSPI